jgi:hypothetical protein
MPDEANVVEGLVEEIVELVLMMRDEELEVTVADDVGRPLELDKLVFTDVGVEDTEDEVMFVFV